MLFGLVFWDERVLTCGFSQSLKFFLLFQRACLASFPSHWSARCQQHVPPSAVKPLHLLEPQWVRRTKINKTPTSHVRFAFIGCPCHIHSQMHGACIHQQISQWFFAEWMKQSRKMPSEPRQAPLNYFFDVIRWSIAPLRQKCLAQLRNCASWKEGKITSFWGRFRVWFCNKVVSVHVWAWTLKDKSWH